MQAHYVLPPEAIPYAPPLPSHARERIAHLEQDNDHLRGIVTEQSSIITGVLQTLENDALTPADRIIGIKAAVGQEYCFSTRAADEATMSIGWVAQVSGVSRARATAFRKKVIGFGKHERQADKEIFTTREEKRYIPPDPGAPPDAKGRWETTITFERTQSLAETLQLLATVNLNRVKAGGSLEQRAERARQLGKTREIPAICPRCEGEHFTVTCNDCDRETQVGPDELGAEDTTAAESGSLQNGAQYGLYPPTTTVINHSSPATSHAPKWSNPPAVPDELAVFARVNDIAPVDAAILYASAGYPVFPVHSVVDAAGACSCGDATCTDQAKHPRTPHGYKDATTDLDQIRRWWDMWPDSNIGLAVPGGYVVIDIDDLAAGRELEKRTALTPTLTAFSGSGGRHMVYALPEGIALGNGTGDLPKEIHVRGSGYIVVAPSFHKSGHQYRWVGVRPIAPIPTALLDLIRPKPKPRTPLPPLADGERRRFITSGDSIFEGNRNKRLYCRGCAARGDGYGYDDAEILTAVHEMNEQCCRPPLSEGDVEKIAASICKHPRGVNGLRPNGAVR
jgi:Bifunctional DNA primase/polymerase, N-terminal/Primase C terminal 1 (PriCT-1)